MANIIHLLVRPGYVHPYVYPVNVDDGDATHVAWSLDDLPGLAADIHRTVADLLLHGPGGPTIDAAIIDRLRGTAPRADDTGDDTGRLPG